MPVATNDAFRARNPCQGNDVVVVRVGGNAFDITLFGQGSSLAQPQHVFQDLFVGELAPEPGAQQHGLELVEEPVGDDQLESSPGPKGKQPVRRSLGDGCADKYPGVEYRAGYGVVPVPPMSRLMACSSS